MQQSIHLISFFVIRVIRAIRVITVIRVIMYDSSSVQQSIHLIKFFMHDLFIHLKIKINFISITFFNFNYYFEDILD
jgi:hypothetical protein